MRIHNILLLFVFYCSGSYADLSQLPLKANTDRSEYRTLILDNGLRVILLSDPDLNISSASLVVGAGSYNDPEDRAGLAHFLEHMLFLGSEKFPGESEYGSFLQSNGGYSNAYTAGDHTNYHFEINHQGFEGALDRFSQFFVAPLFNPDFTKREMNAVDSEFEKNLQHDGWRQQEIFRTLVREEHPERHFAIGNLKTLGGIKRKEFIDFYNRFYSANQMALSMTSNNSLDQMEAWTKTYFTTIKNHNRSAIAYTAKLIDTDRSPGLAMIEPVKDLRSLDMIFPIRGTRSMYRSKPDDLIGFLLAYEGQGSLLSYLKTQGLATTLSGGAYKATKDYSLFSVTVGLTPKGTKHWQQVMAATFAAVENLRQSNYPQYLFQERATMARLNELYADKGEGTMRAVTLANNALHYPLEDAQRIAYLWDRSSSELYFDILKSLRPDNMIATLQAKGAPTNLSEKQFGVQYSLQAFSPQVLASLMKPKLLKTLTLPEANKFIPNNVPLIPQAPVKLIEEPGLTLFYAQDTEFKKPQVSYQIRIRQPKSLGTLESVVKRDFYTSVLNEMINEQTYVASTAGLSVAVVNSTKGISLSVSGYNQSADAILNDVLKQMRKPHLDNARFEAIKEKKVRQLENAVFADAYQQAAQVERKLLYEHYFTPKEKLASAQSLNLDSLKKYAATLFKEGNVEMMVYGNVSQNQAESAAHSVVSNLKIQPITAGDVYQNRILRLSPNKPVITSNVLKVNNSAYRQGFLLGEATPKNRAAALVIKNFFANPYYSEMRTRQQLGYIVAGFTSETENKLHARFIIQSADYSADKLLTLSEAFLTTLPTLFDALPDKEFEEIRAGVRSKLEQKDKSIAKRSARYFSLAFEQDQNWSRTDDTLIALNQLNRNDLKAMLQLIAKKSQASSFAVLSMAKQHATSVTAVEDSITNMEVWKRGQTFD